MKHEDIGKIEGFNPKSWLDAANTLTAYDEPLRAIELLRLLPGYYRDHVPQEIKELEIKIIRQMATSAWYARDIETQFADDERAEASIAHLPRNLLVWQDVDKLNSESKTPHLFELAPGEYTIPIGMAAKHGKFTYCARSLNARLEQEVAKKLGGVWQERPPEGSPQIFVAFEILEHLHFERDIQAEYLRAGLDADIIHISTPKYTYDGRRESLEWTGRDLGHLRTYTPREFIEVVTGMFPGYNWNLYDSNVMHLRGEKHGN